MRYQKPHFFNFSFFFAFWESTLNYEHFQKKMLTLKTDVFPKTS